MSNYFIGIDSGTQSTKTILLDANSGEVVASASQHYDLIEGLPAGHKEQHPADWIAAIRYGIKTVLESSGVDRSAVKGIGVSGQQHGFVALDERDEVIRPAKLWCDTATSTECEAIIGALGGRLDQTLGNIALISNLQPATCNLKLNDGLEEVFFCHDHAEVNGAVGDIVSLIPWQGEVTGILTQGLKWVLQNETLYPHKTRGISNEMTGDTATIKIKSGLLLVVHRRETVIGNWYFQTETNQ